MHTARDGAGGLVEHANRQSCCSQLDSGRSLDQIICDFVIDCRVHRQTANRRISESKKKHRGPSASYEAQEASVEASTTGLAFTGMILRADTGCYLSPQSSILVDRERVCAFGNGSRELSWLCMKKQKRKRENSNNCNIMIKHMRITDRGNE